MWSFFQPDERRLRTILEEQSRLGYSYPQQGATIRREPPAGYVMDCNRVQLGKGEAVFRAACQALRRWKQFPPGWTHVWPADTPIEVGRNIAVVARTLGLYWVNAARIVYVVEDTSLCRQFGFAYGTLPGHVERGEERFVVEWLPDDTVWYDICAISQPRLWTVRLAYPVARMLQKAFARDSKAAMVQAVASVAASGVKVP